MPNSIIIVYATNWCGDCLRTRKVLKDLNIEHEWINIDRNEQAEQFVLQHNHGMRSVPTIVFPDGTILVEPKSTQLVNKLYALGLTSENLPA